MGRMQRVLELVPPRVALPVLIIIYLIPTSQKVFALYLEPSLWHFYLILSFLAISIILSYQYGLKGGLISAGLSTLVVFGIELALPYFYIPITPTPRCT